MGKALGGLPEEASLSAGSGVSAGPESESIGRYLARQRRLRGLSLEEVAALTRIPTRSLERLESGAFDRQPDGFTRGFVRTVAGAIGLDPQVTVERMLTEVRPARIGAPQSLLPALVGLALLALLAGIGVAVASWWDRVAATSPREEPQLTRRDFVRELSERRAVRAPVVAPVGPGTGAVADESADFALPAPARE